MKLRSEKSRRKKPSPKAERSVWAAAAGRCTLCNRSVLENEDLGVAVSIGELAHNIGWGAGSPRGDVPLSEQARAAANNLLLLCRNCHKPVDADGYIGVYSWEQLAAFKEEHEERVRFLTSIDADRKAHILRVVGDIRNATPALTYEAVLSATTSSGLFPTRLPDSFRTEVEVDLRGLVGAGTPDYYATVKVQIDRQVRRLSEGIASGDVKRLAVFAWARIPVLVYLGAQLDDKVEALIFQRQRVDSENAWKWPAHNGSVCDFEFTKERDGSAGVALILNLSGTIRLDELPDAIQDHTVYAIRPMAPAECSPQLIASPEVLLRFNYAIRDFLAFIEKAHGKIGSLALFPAIPLSAAVTVGRVLMPNVSPRLHVYDRDEAGAFRFAMEVVR